jgi:hypothetical protein
MDKEAIATSKNYKDIEQAHFNGGYFSEEVREEVERLKDRSEEDKRAVFKKAFNETYTLAVYIKGHPLFSLPNDNITLEGLGTIWVDVREEEKNEDVEEAYKGILVRPESFDPTPRKQEEWPVTEGDPLGLEAQSTIVSLDHEPKGWHEHVFADLEGNLDAEADVDYELFRLLDMRETLQVVMDTLTYEAAKQSPAD